MLLDYALHNRTLPCGSFLGEWQRQMLVMIASNGRSKVGPGKAGEMTPLAIGC